MQTTNILVLILSFFCFSQLDDFDNFDNPNEKLGPNVTVISKKVDTIEINYHKWRPYSYNEETKKSEQSEFFVTEIYIAFWINTQNGSSNIAHLENLSESRFLSVPRFDEKGKIRAVWRFEDKIYDVTADEINITLDDESVITEYFKAGGSMGSFYFE